LQGGWNFLPRIFVYTFFLESSPKVRSLQSPLSKLNLNTLPRRITVNQPTGLAFVHRHFCWFKYNIGQHGKRFWFVDHFGDMSTRGDWKILFCASCYLRYTVYVYTCIYWIFSIVYFTPDVCLQRKMAPHDGCYAAAILLYVVLWKALFCLSSFAAVCLLCFE